MEYDFENRYPWEDEDEPKLSPEQEARIKRKANLIVIGLISSVILMPLILFLLGFSFLEASANGITRDDATASVIGMLLIGLGLNWIGLLIKALIK